MHPGFGEVSNRCVAASRASVVDVPEPFAWLGRGFSMASAVRRRILGVIMARPSLAVLLFLTFACRASAADYPVRPITFIVPWGAGGGTDAVGRVMASLLERDLGRPVNVV